MGVATALATPFALLLAISGVEKVRSPDGARDALALVGAPLHPLLLVALPAAEIAAGLSFLVVSGRWPAMLLLFMYGLFVAVVAGELLRGSTASCGCFGARSGAVSPWHLGVVLAGAAAAAATLATPSLAPVAGILDLGWYVPAALVAVVTATGLIRGLLVDLHPVLDLSRTPEVHA